MYAMGNQCIVDYLKECGVCQVCQLRYLVHGNDYKNFEESFGQLKIKYEASKEVQLNKKQRVNICPICVGLFSPHFQEELVLGILEKNINNYECDGIVIAITIPILLQIRQLSMWYALLVKFGENEININRPPDVPLKEAVKIILNPILCQHLKKRYNTNGLMININLVHNKEAEEISVLEKLNHVAFPLAKAKKVSRGILEKQYSPLFVSTELFTKYIPTPPIIPLEALGLESISLMGPTTYIAGRYRKITRQLSHTPWVLNGKRITEDSIEELITSNISPFFCMGENRGIFMSSGREDVDVRCLGKGRPFVLEISNTFRTTLPKEVANQMEKEIDSSLKVSVWNLQIVYRNELFHIKTGEEMKRKYYRALCKLENPVSTEILALLNITKSFTVQQKTPLRVLHRRPLHTRPKSIYSLKSRVYRQQRNILIVDIVSQAGTYIKELIHGDFGRTCPSIGSIIGLPIDIIALDVTGIDLDWPKDTRNTA